MEISRINGGAAQIQNPFQKTEAVPAKVPFSNVIKGYLGNVDATVKQASVLTTRTATGEVDNIHDVTIATQKAKIALELTVAVRDRAVESYQEIMRMQI